MKPWLKKSFLLLLVILVASELVVRLFFGRSMSGRFDYGYHPTVGFQENADGTVDLIRAGGRRFRPQHFTREPAPGTLRIFVIGDSVPRGGSLEGAYAGRLGEQLRAQGVNAESFNLGLAGNGARRNQVVLRQALHYRPGLIILHVNNSNEFEDEREWARSQEFKSWHPKNWLMKSLALRRLYEMKTERIYWEWLPPEIRDLKGVNDSADEMLASQNPARRREWDERVAKVTAGSVALARAAGVPILLVTQARSEKDPAGQPVLDDHGLDAMGEKLIGQGVYHLSMKDALAAKDFPRLYGDSAHLRDEGHDLLAQAIVRRLKTAGLIP